MSGVRNVVHPYFCYKGVGLTRGVPLRLKISKSFLIFFIKSSQIQTILPNNPNTNTYDETNQKYSNGGTNLS